MNDGLKIILARMDTNPEEFIDNRKWRRLVENDWPMFTKEEQEAYSTKLRSILLDTFSENVLKELMDEDETTETIKYKAINRYAIGWSDARATVSLTPTQVAGSGGNYISNGVGSAVSIGSGLGASPSAVMIKTRNTP